MPGDLLDMLIAQGRTKLVRRDRQVRAIAKPRFDLGPVTRLFQFGDNTLEAAEVRLRQQFRNEHGNSAGLSVTHRRLEFITDVVEQSHDLLLALRYRGQRRSAYGCFSFFAARKPVAVVSF